ncbi:MAG TPA: LysR family transcriptional regulator [Kofleriaceae bacterium]|nr:LysR family transcriptional regulator [Kofleriaceae bacterium]
MNNVGVTLEQARALDAVERAGTFTKAAALLRRGHTSVLYLIKTLEDTLGFAVLDRSGYRTRLTARGRRVLESCRALLEAEGELATTILELREGWEPTIAVVFDGIVASEPLLHAVGRLVTDKVPTRIDVRAEFLGGVEDAFDAMPADLMISVLPPRGVGLTAVELPVLRASLVARADHPLARGKHTERELKSHLLLTVRGSDPRLDLSTVGIEARSTVLLNDFAAKRAAILAGIGYGWLPDGMITRELASKRLARIRWTRPSTHVFHPRLYHRGQPGPAARQLIAALAA